ncbi:MAG TPA: Mu-like prophage major head subunit gpT family protein, partial [Phycisphaerae bacterium]|nr:Mu-like prophage major head subunit gpT family protein [Phycisphaerae bacterium]
MAIIDTGLTESGLRSEFFRRLEATPTYYGDLATRIQSNKDKETYRFLGSIPRVREWGTGRLAKDVNVESYDVENLKYEATLEVDRDEIDDDQTGQIRLRVNELAVNAATHPDWLIAQLLINGATAGYLSFDGLTFFQQRPRL